MSFGVIPIGTGRRGHRPREPFDITGSNLVTIELLAGFSSLTHPDETGITAWEHLFPMGGHGCLLHGSLGSPCWVRVWSTRITFHETPHDINDHRACLW